jgi:hypothetical protein
MRPTLTQSETQTHVTAIEFGKFGGIARRLSVGCVHASKGVAF